MLISLKKQTFKSLTNIMTSGTLIYIKDLGILEKIFIRITGFYNTPLFYPESFAVSFATILP